MERPARGSLLEPRARGRRDHPCLRRPRRRAAHDADRLRARAGRHLASARLPTASSCHRAGRWPSSCASTARRARPPRAVDFASALERATAEIQGRIDRSARVSSSSELFDDWVDRSLADVVMMTTRDGQRLVSVRRHPVVQHRLRPRRHHHRASRSCGCSPRWRAASWGTWPRPRPTDDDPVRDAQPGKILHEVRHGEMAALGEVPFGRYYGSHDATPLFVMLAEAYHRHTGDLDFIREPVAEHRGGARLDRRAGRPRRRRLPRVRAPHSHRPRPAGLEGLERLGLPRRWHAWPMGRSRCPRSRATRTPRAWPPPRWPTALDLPDRAHLLRAQADALRARFEAAFWVEELGTYGIALDGDKRLCRVRTSNPGHCLWTGIASVERAGERGRGAPGRADVLRLGRPHPGGGRGAVQPDVLPQRLDLAARQCHRGAGAVALRTCTSRPVRITHGLFEASRHFDLARHAGAVLRLQPPRRERGRPAIRWPARRRHGRPERSSCCSRRAWGWKSMPRHARSSCRTRGCLPSSSTSRIENIAMGETRVDLNVEREGDGVAVEVLARSGEMSVVNVK